MLASEPSSDQQQMNNELMGEENSGVTEPDFPHAKLALLDEKISSPRWVVPVLPEQELEVLLQASIDLCRKGEVQIYYSLRWSCMAVWWYTVCYFNGWKYLYRKNFMLLLRFWSPVLYCICQMTTSLSCWWIHPFWKKTCCYHLHSCHV
jgi:hypothetical protein